MPTILFVDDEPAILMALKRSLRKEPYDVLTAASAAEALELLASNPVTVVVSDERMPGISGTDLLEHVRGAYPAAVRVMLTGEVGLRPSGRKTDPGLFFRVLTKPILPTALAEVLRLAIHAGFGAT
jgi:DNA-binding NtrC family response regulator